MVNSSDVARTNVNSCLKHRSPASAFLLLKFTLNTLNLCKYFLNHQRKMFFYVLECLLYIQFKQKNVLIIVVNRCFKSKNESSALMCVVVVSTVRCVTHSTLFL